MSNWDEIGFAPKGWQCPVCGAVYSPMTPMCYNCTGKQKSFTVSTGTYEVQSIEEYLKDLEQSTNPSSGKDKLNDISRTHNGEYGYKVLL